MRDAGPIVFMGAGAVGGYVGGMLSAAGEDIVLIDAWPGHVEAIRANGLMIDTPEGTIKARPRALHICDVHQLAGQSVGSRFSASNSTTRTGPRRCLTTSLGCPDRHDAERAC